MSLHFNWTPSHPICAIPGESPDKRAYRRSAYKYWLARTRASRRANPIKVAVFICVRFLSCGNSLPCSLVTSTSRRPTKRKLACENKSQQESKSNQGRGFHLRPLFVLRKQPSMLTRDLHQSQTNKEKTDLLICGTLGVHLIQNTKEDKIGPDYKDNG